MTGIKNKTFMEMKNMQNRKKEEILEAIWSSIEKGNFTINNIKKIAHIPVNSEALNILEKEDIIKIDNDKIKFTDKGKEKARIIIRRHRLAERLMVDILDMNLESIEAGACEYEHLIAPGITESICTLLGHPKTCPHGNSIPEGKCCLEARKNVENVLTSLDKVETGKSIKIAYFCTQKHPVLHKLISFGLLPGTKITVHQKSPSFVIQLENAQLALEKDVASCIFVWK